MKYVVIKSSFDGISGGGSQYSSIDDVLKEVSYHKGWLSKDQLHSSIRKWSENAQPGCVFCTQVTAIVATGEDRSSACDDECPYCDCLGLNYDEIMPVDGGYWEQKVECPECNKKWVEVFGLVDRKELN